MTIQMIVKLTTEILIFTNEAAIDKKQKVQNPWNKQVGL